MSSNIADQENTNLENIISKIGNMTRLLRNSLKDLGLDQTIMQAAQAIPDARARLNYVVNKTAQAAERVLNCVDVAKPLQDELNTTSNSLTQRWDKWFENPIELTEARELVTDTRQFLKKTQELTDNTNAELMEIMIAQDFQDLTGQVITKMMHVIQELEKELIQVLLENIPETMRPELKQQDNLINGPQINHTNDGVVANQDQVDSLLESLGF